MTQPIPVPVHWADVISPAALAALDSLDDLPPLPPAPGGWARETVACGDRVLQMHLPARPDAFLDDPEVAAASRADDYMPYWGYVWPGALRMLHLMAQAPWPIGAEVLELGAGVGLVGLAAALRGDQVTFTDYDPRAGLTCLHNARDNGFTARAGWLDWRAPWPRTFPAILGCEVTYDRNNHGLLCDLLEAMLAPDGVCWFGDPGRFWARHFVGLARARFRVRVLDEQLAEIPEPGDRFQIFEIRKF